MIIFIVAAFLTQHFIPRSYCVIAKAVQRPKQKIILGQWTQRDSLDKLSFVRGKEESIKLCFHSLVCWSISTSAVLLSGKELFGAITRLPLLSISHESPKILILHPSPTRRSPPWDLTFLAFKMLLHAYEPKFFFASKIEPLGKYFALNTLQKREFVSCINHHTCFASIASLNLHKSLKPISPSLFGLHRTSHFLQ